MTFSKTIFKNWNCTLNFNNIFKNIEEEEKFTIKNISSTSRYLIDEHEISIAIRYSFGKIKETEFTGKSMDETTDRLK